jgi:hypothetical protein
MCSSTSPTTDELFTVREKVGPWAWVPLRPSGNGLDTAWCLWTIGGMADEREDLEPVDLQIGPARQVAANDFSIRVDGVEPEQAEAIERRVADVLQRWFATLPRAALTDVSRPPDERPEPEAIDVGFAGPSLDEARQRTLVDAVRAAVADELRNQSRARDPKAGM